jgi:hypothetical protein
MTEKIKVGERSLLETGWGLWRRKPVLCFERKLVKTGFFMEDC